MMLSYMARAAVLGFGVFFVANLLVGLICSAVARWRGFERMEARQAARLLLILRLLPSGAGVVLSAAVLLPAYFAYERQSGAERVSPSMILAALAGAAACVESLLRSLQAILRSIRWREQVIETAEPFLAVAGIWKPRIIASRGFLETIPESQRAVAMRHELAHFASRDNLKQLAMLLAPSMGPGVQLGFDTLERTWMRYAERAADDRAVDSDPERALLLAEVLVKVARERRTPSPVLASALITSVVDLQPRVERLLQMRSAGSTSLPDWLAVLLPCAPLAIVLLPARPLFEAIEQFLLHA